MSELARMVSKVIGDKIDSDKTRAYKKITIEGHKGGCGCAGCKNLAVNNANYWLDDDAINGLERGYRFFINRKGDIASRQWPPPNEQGNTTQPG